MQALENVSSIKNNENNKKINKNIKNHKKTNKNSKNMKTITNKVHITGFYQALEKSNVKNYQAVDKVSSKKINENNKKINKNIKKYKKN